MKQYLQEKHPVILAVLREFKKPLNKVIDAFLNKNRNKVFKNNSYETFKSFCNILNDAGIPFWLTFGTLLGAIREKSFINHDLDIDVGVFDDTDFVLLDKELRGHGFVMKRKIEVFSSIESEFGFELTYALNDVSIDIFVFSQKDKFVYTHDFLQGEMWGSKIIYNIVRTLKLPFDGLEEYSFLGNKVYIPKNYGTYLSSHYGDSYMTPDPSWSTTTSPAATVIEGSIGISTVLV